MQTAKLFQHGGSQAVRLPKAFRFQGTEVAIEKRGGEVILKPVRRQKFKTLGEVGKYLAKKYPEAGDFPDVYRSKKHERPILEW
jgi:antitoxin VapB